jgi:NAD-dependent DNA ligase
LRQGCKRSDEIVPHKCIPTGGKQAGSKLDKAQKLAVKIIDEAGVLKLCGSD